MKKPQTYQKTKLLNRINFLNQIYLRDFIYGGIDGAITTFAVVSGVKGGQLSPVVILILGFANLIADGFSMAVSNYLGTRAEIEQKYFFKKTENREEISNLKSATKASLFTFIAFIAFGFIPLFPFVFKLPYSFLLSIFLTECVFLIIGSIKSLWSYKPWIYSALETLIIGSLAASLAYFVGWIMQGYIGT